MKHLDITSKFVATSQAKGYLDYLLNENIFQRAIDAYAFAAAYGMKSDIGIPESVGGRTNSLAEVFRLNENVRLALEAGVHITCKRKGQPEPQSSSEVMEIVAKYAEAGLESLKNKWEGKTRSQIQSDIQTIISSAV